jgi:uncharacterized protein with PIN domain
MLGSLARWLRILGYDTLYHVNRNDDELRNEAKQTNRILVTRDLELHQKALKTGVKTVLIKSVHIRNQLEELIESLNINLIPMNTRCPRCNGDLGPIQKKEVEGKVPKQSYRVFNDYWNCSRCNAIYWKGSHWIHIKDTLKKIGDSKSL